ncbi:MAG: Membrane protein [uncultured Truepera sp.]|uniref:Membrane protein n=1 Tax=uncultured Truepera sp. TaxID=543023 RepID=A0A6J4VT71_9DEIN|nr:MAG: Membrane protein [uncultured Truepera sp.]
MQTAIRTVPAAKSASWAGHLVSAPAVLFLLLDGAMKLAAPAPVVQASAALGLSGSVLPGLGVLLLACLFVYLVPRTAVFGAVLLTGYLGGAVATHVRVGLEPVSLAFPLVLGALLWGGLWVRDARLRALLSRLTETQPSVTRR